MSSCRLLFIISLLIFSSSISWATPAIKPLTSPSQIILAHENINAFPWVFQKGEQFVGLDIELINLVAKELNIQISYQAQPWHNALKAMQYGIIDGVFAASYNLERERYGRYPTNNAVIANNKHIHMSGYSLYILKDSPILFDGKQFNKLAKPIAVQQGFSIVPALTAFNVPLSITTDTPKSMLAQVIQGQVSAAAIQTERADIIINADPRLKAALKKYPTQLQPFHQKPYFVMFSKQFMARYPGVAESFWDKLEQVKNSVLFKKQLVIFQDRAQELTVSVLVTPKQRRFYKEIFKLFEKENHVSVIMMALNDSSYKNHLQRWLTIDDNGPDILYWQASQRLFHLVKQDLILPITDIWQEQNYDQDFSNFKSSVSYNGEVYALPQSLYQWGLYYKKSLLAKYGEEPKNWQAFITICHKMKADGIEPIGIGTKSNWPAAAWFDYINLRINGLDFHKKLLMGLIPFTDPRVINIFKEWKKLVEPGFYNQNRHQLAWSGVIPYLYREKIGFTLIGNFAESYLNEGRRTEIGFIPFPSINAQIPPYEEMPIDIFMIAKRSKKIKLAKEFIKFMARADIQSKLSAALAYLPANQSAKISHRLSDTTSPIKNIQGVSQYFDRDTIPEFEVIALPILVEFINSGNIEKTIQALEQARLTVFQNREDQNRLTDRNSLQ